MKKKNLFKVFALVIVLVLGIAGLVACDPKEPEPEPGPDYDKMYQQLANVLANSLDANLSDGFYMSSDVSASFKFDDSDKSQYDWDYSFKIEGNILATGENDKFGIRLVDNKNNSTLFGIYNLGGNMYFESGEVKYAFENVSLFSALRAMLSANDIELSGKLNDLVVMEGASLSEILKSVGPSVFTMLSTGINQSEDGKELTLSMNLAETVETLADLLSSIAPDIDLSAITELVPNGLNVDILFKTDGTYLNGVKISNMKITTGDKGVFKFDLKTDDLFGNVNPDYAPLTAFNVADKFDGIELSKILSVKASGNIYGVDGNSFTNKLTWKVNANLDLVKMMNYNFLLNAENSTGGGGYVFEDNYFHIQLAMDGYPLLDIGYDPNGFGSADLMVSVHLSKILYAATGMSSIPLYDTLPQYFLLSFDWGTMPSMINSIMNLINGVTGTSAQSSAYMPVADTIGADSSLEDILGVLASFIKTGDFDIDYASIRKSIEGTDIYWILDRLFDSKTKVFSAFGSKFEFGLPTSQNDEDIRSEFQIRKDTDGSYKTRDYTRGGKNVNPPVSFDSLVTGTNGALLTYTDQPGGSGDGVIFHNDTDPISYDEIMGIKGQYVKVNYTDLYGNAQVGWARIAGISGVDKDIIGEAQDVNIEVSFIDPTGLIRFLTHGLGKAVVEGMLTGFDINNIFIPTHTLSAKVTLQTMENVDVKLYNGNNEILDTTVLTAGDDILGLKVEATATYANGATKTKSYSYNAQTGIGATDIGELHVYVDDYKNTLTKYFRSTFGLDMLIAIEDISFTVEAFGNSFDKTIKVNKPISYELSYYNDLFMRDVFTVGDSLINATEIGSYIIYTLTYKNANGDTYTREVNPQNSDVTLLNFRALTGFAAPDADKYLNEYEIVNETDVLYSVSLGGLLSDTIGIEVIGKNSQYNINNINGEVNDEKTSINGSFDISLLAGISNDNLIYDINVYDLSNQLIEGVTFVVAGTDNNKVNLPLLFTDTKTINFTLSGIDASKVLKVEILIKNTISDNIISKSDRIFITESEIMAVDNVAKEIKADTMLDNLFYIYAKNSDGVIVKHDLKYVEDGYYFVNGDSKIAVTVGVTGSDSVVIADAINAEGKLKGDMIGKLKLEVNGLAAYELDIDTTIVLFPTFLNDTWTAGDSANTYTKSETYANISEVLKMGLQSILLQYLGISEDGLTFISGTDLYGGAIVADLVANGQISMDANKWIYGAVFTVQYNGQQYMLKIEIA